MSDRELLRGACSLAAQPPVVPDGGERFELPSWIREKYGDTGDFPVHDSPGTGDGTTIPGGGDQLASVPGVPTDSSGAVQVASAGPAQAELARTDDEQKTVLELTRRVNVATERAYANLRGLLQQAAGATVGITPGFAYGADGAPYTLDAARLRALDGNDTYYESERAACMAAVIAASPELASYFEIFFENGCTDEAAWTAMALFGRFRSFLEPLALGDVGYFLNPMLDRGGAWGVVIEPGVGREPAAILQRSGENGPTLEIALRQSILAVSVRPLSRRVSHFL